MKILRNLSILLVLVLPGCFSDSSVNPDFTLPAKMAKSWIVTSDAASLQKEVVLTEQVNGQTGGTIIYDLKIANISVSGSLTIPENSFEGNLNISTVLDSKTTTQDLSPTPYDFPKPLILSLEYRGVKLKDVNPEQVDFYYIDDDGQLVKAEYASIVVDPAAGILKIVDAKISHFSRYGWAK